ncbi:antirepressor N-terminal domain protein [Acinetobacter sp. WC-743]|uniref:phage antirepressor N-terminal domain-containing protein n=1 Tax=Acinetobacter sp. WC-743 TaxID=903945 RepID=UPI0002AED929|nr:phage antirepressor N-terminal domain-containing protein [Acinetobacter sp. WC-743]ELW81959.1 antirepressor N-terminal domain protein [Acinetobacter sp. WC-743]
MNAKIQLVKFNHHQIPVYFIGDEPYVAMKPICENIGLQWEAQRQRIKRNHALSQGACMIKAPSKGGEQEVLTLPIGYLNGWLFGIDVNRVKPEIKDTLVKYQLECYDVLYKHFMPKAVKQIDHRQYVSKKEHDEMVLKYHRLFRTYDDSIDVLRNQVRQMETKNRRYDIQQHQRSVTIEWISQSYNIPVDIVIEELEIAQLIEKRNPYVKGAPLIWTLSPRNKHMDFVIIDSIVEAGQAKDQIRLTEDGAFYVKQLLQKRLKL